MLVPPRRWEKTATGEIVGGFYHQKSSFVRTFSRRHLQKLKAVPAEQLSPILDAVNVLGRTAWRINQRTLDVVERIWDNVRPCVGRWVCANLG